MCKIETLSRTRQQIMATATSPRREINARLRQTGPLETDGFTVKSLLKNAKLFLFNSSQSITQKFIVGKSSTASRSDTYS